VAPWNAWGDPGTRVVQVDWHYDEEKFAEVLLYVAKRLEADPAGGAMKLNKALFFADFAHVRGHGRPITGAEYQKLQYGPAPRRMVPVRDALIAGGAATIREEVYLGKVQHRLVPLRDPDMSKLEASEREVLDQVLDRMHGRSGTFMSDVSHQVPGWQMVDEGETIPYETAFLRKPVITDAIRHHAEQLAKRYQ
jgi:uncharacterized phage-associated protein